MYSKESGLTAYAKLCTFYKNMDTFVPFLHKGINDCIESNFFPDKLKEATLTPVHKKTSKSEKSNYRPISILPLLSKVFERVLHKQLSTYFDKIFSQHQCGFRKGFNAQTGLIYLEELWKKSIDENEKFGAILIDLSKAFDCMHHGLLIAKIKAYGVSSNSTKLIADYLTNRKQRTKVGNHLSSWLNIDTGVPQGSILGPLLFNIYLCDLLYTVPEVNILNYADDTTPFVIDRKARNSLQRNFQKVTR